MSPAKPEDKMYGELVDALSKHFKPVPSEIVERFRFHSRTWKPGESVANVVVKLQSLMDFCINIHQIWRWQLKGYGALERKAADSRFCGS